ncbi:MAG: diadenylate cyclase CdaA [Endomicrobiales bacterium]|nr:diadenylate cyclase CdaA [Endomicrobiales bacterium]
MEFLKMVWSSYVVHFIDIFVVAYIFYRLMLLIKGTRAVQILVGLLILVAVTFLANLIHLKTLGWLLEKFWVATVVILAVVFQPEIRSALAQLGTQRWGKIFVHAELGFINEIIDAIKELSDKHIGAIIVLELDTGLRNYIETGTIINAQVSKELVLSIFNIRSPLHDGAVIVEDARLVAAGCVLPLSHGSGISKVLGTRHRASVGLSEISDALVLVVSEETGMVSVAREGKLETKVDPEELRVKLMDIFRSRSESTVIRKHNAR